MQEMHSGSGVVTSCISHNPLERYVHVKLALNCNLCNEGEQ